MARRSWQSSYLKPARLRGGLLALGALLGLAAFGAGAPDNHLQVISAPGRAGPLSWQAVEFMWQPAGSAPATAERWHLVAAGVAIAGWRGRLEVDCADGRLRPAGPWCRRGRFRWQGGDGLELAGGIGAPASGHDRGVVFAVDDLGISGQLLWPAGGQASSPRVLVQLADLKLADLPPALIGPLGLSVLEGRLSGRIEWSGDQLRLDTRLKQGAFDRADGLVAGADLSAVLSGRVDLAGPGAAPTFSFELVQDGGELLAGPIYLPPPDGALQLQADGRWSGDARVQIDRLVLIDGGQVELRGSLALAQVENAWSLQELAVEQARLTLPGAWERWGEGPAAARGFADLATRGALGARLIWRSGQIEALTLDLESVSVGDAQGRFAVESIDGHLERSDVGLEADLAWSALKVFSLAFGGSRLTLAGERSDWQLTRPLVLPLLNGAVVVDRLRSAGREGGSGGLVLDARIEPLDLSALTDMLGWPEFGGQLSGRFPGIRLSGEEIAFTGGIDVHAFSGQIRLGDLVIERPFGSLPALAAQVSIERLNLAQLTGAFNFGHIDGELSGWLHDLRLLDWRPVAMDARVFTLDDAPRRRISQRAVENLSQLGGGGAAALGATLLRMFDEFPYRRAGLACRLDRNICHIDGVAPHESGGFYIVQGRGLPHLDVIGHRRLVDWPRLVAQLVAITEG